MSIVSSKVKIYSNAALTNLVATVNGTTSLTQTLTVTGLNATTNYWAVAEATDNNGLTGYSAAQMFTTAAASYVFTNDSVGYDSNYDTLSASVNVSGPLDAHFTECGVQFALTSDFSGTLITGSNTTSPANFFSGNVTGFAEHTTYYYRFFATSTEYGTQTYAPQNNTVTTHYDEPTLTISSSNVTDTTATVTFLYTGNMPVDSNEMSGLIARRDGQGSPINVQFEHLVAGTPMPVSLSGLVPNTEYAVTWDVAYYDDEVSQVHYFTTLSARPSVAITGVTNITPSGADVGISIS